MKLIQLTDIHLTQRGRLLGGRDPVANFQRALHEVLVKHGDAALIAITGDLSDRGELADYLWLRDQLAGVPIPVALMIGNHDNREAFAQVFPDRCDPAGFVQGACDLGAARALFLDTVDPGSHAGVLCDLRLAWLEDELAAHPGPFLIFMHHNPVPTHIGPLDRVMLQDVPGFAAVIARHRDRVAHIFHGHCHLPMSGALVGVPVSSGRGTNHAGYPSFGEAELMALSDLPESYNVVFVGPLTTTVMMVEFGYHRAAPRIAAVP